MLLHHENLCRVNLFTVFEHIRCLIYSLKDLGARIQESAMTVALVKESFVEMYPPAVPFSPKIMSMQAVYSSLKDWLNDKDANIALHSTRHFHYEAGERFLRLNRI